MPTLLRVYSNNQPNPVLQDAIQFVCKQFYILHRKPFILQMFGSVAPILDMTCAADGAKDCTKVGHLLPHFFLSQIVLLPPLVKKSS